jgi:uncharacterized membrane protein
MDSAAVVDQAAAVAGEPSGGTVGTRSGRGLSITGVVLGAASIAIGLFSVLGWVLGLAAIVVAALAVRRNAANRRIAVWGTWLGVAGSVLSVLVLVLALRGR